MHVSRSAYRWASHCLELEIQRHDDQRDPDNLDDNLYLDDLQDARDQIDAAYLMYEEEPKP